MGDIERIQPLLTEFGKVWEKYFPDMSFMEVIDNFQSWIEQQSDEFFYIEDDEIIEKFHKFAKYEQATKRAMERLYEMKSKNQ